MSLRVAICQAPSVAGDVPKNLRTLEEYVARHENDADLCVFPECFVGGYGSVDELKPGCTDICSLASESANGSSFQFVSRVAVKHNISIVYGFIEIMIVDGNEKRYIAMNWINDKGELIHTYRKSHLWTPSAFERNHFEPSSFGLSPIIEICGVKVGCLICFDVEVVEPARCLALQGAELLLVIGANSDFFTLDCTIKVRAFENLCHLIYCNQMEAACCGCSAGVDPTGAYLPGTPLKKQVPDEVVVFIEPQAEKWVTSRKRNPLFAVRQPLLYSVIVDSSAEKRKINETTIDTNKAARASSE